ncbi:MAG TPA: hypothetical protein VHU88_20910 [Sporichthyaceae bacterium]|jgi:hypothetical protein|nr:hypothetical protein [Sporichthyaceae bacterium]
MVVTPPGVTAHHLNHAGQNVLTIASWVITAAVFGLSIWMSRRAKHPIYACMIVAAGVGALAEPLYDVMFNLYFYSGRGMQKTYTIFNIPQPVWAYSGYVILYGLPAIFIVKEIHDGRMTPNRLWMWFGIEILESCVFEIAGINMGTYTYWGPHVFRLWHYPIVIAVLEGVQTVTFAVVCANLLHRARDKWSALGTVAIFPITMLGGNFGAGAAVIIAINAQDTSPNWVRFGTLVSIGMACAVVRLVIGLIPPPGRVADAPQTAPTGRALAGAPA